MPITSPPTITALPSPPDPNNRATFNTLAYPWSVAQQTLATEVGAVAANVYSNAQEAQTQASASAASAASANAAKLAAQAAQAAAEGVVATIPDGTINDTTTSTTGVWSSQKVNTLLAAKQDVLISGTNIKTLGGVSLLGSGDIPTGSGIVRSARASNSMLAMSDKGKLIDITSGTFTQTFDAAATLGDGWWCYFLNSGTGTVTLDPNASEQINGASTYAALGGQYHLVQCDGTTLTAVPINHCGTHVVELRTGNGAGSTNTKIRRFATTVQAVGAAITYSDSSTLGASFTINQPGIYAIGYSDVGASGNPMNMGLSINSTQLTSQISAIDAANRLAISLSYVGLLGMASGVFRLAPGDVVRAHTGTSDGETSTAAASFYVRKIGV